MLAPSKCRRGVREGPTVDTQSGILTVERSQLPKTSRSVNPSLARFTWASCLAIMRFLPPIILRSDGTDREPPSRCG